MKKTFAICYLLIAICAAMDANAVSAGTVGAADNARAMTTTYANNGNIRGTQASVNAYMTNQRNNYFMVTQPDVDTACRQKIYACLSGYCGDVTVVPGQNPGGRCAYSTEGELYNYALLCLQKDTTILLPQYGVNTKNGTGGMNTAARLCPSYVQQELMSYLSMSNMAEQLNRSRSGQCVQRRQELEAATSCHAIALAYGNGTSSQLTSMLTDYCGAGAPGGSAEMVTRFSSAGNVGANIWGWAEKIVNLDLNNKGADWQAAMDSVLAGYTNRMNVACGDNVQMNTVSYGSGNSGQPTSLQTAAALAVGMAFPGTDAQVQNPYETWSIYQEIQSMSDVYDFATARQVVQAGLGNVSTTQNAFLTSAQMDNMQTAYKLGTKVFILRDSARCYIVPVADLDTKQRSVIAQSFGNCVSQF
ncbi:MAG: hypothetical protein LBJ73_03300 [Rickettsiales bacterium]|jgi:hypothetical protein|nr:hypothetical protein [Rickettsiales bacterium]